MIEKLGEVVIHIRTNLDEMKLEVLYPALAYKLAFDIANTGAIHSLGGNENVHHLGDGPEGSAKRNVLELLENCRRRFYLLLFCFFRLVRREMSDEDLAIEVDPSHFVFLRKLTRAGCLTVSSLNNS